jgi:hypothetical protein
MSTQPQAAAKAPETGTEALLFKDDPQFWYEIERLFSAAEYGGALFGEVIAIAKQIKSGDYDGWYDAMSGFADRLADEAAEQLRRGHKISARDSFLRACSYYRSADFFLHAHADDPRVKRAFERSTACYRQASPFFTPAIEPVEIPFEGTTLTGYFHPADPSSQTGKTLLLNSGFDGSPEKCTGWAPAPRSNAATMSWCLTVRGNIHPFIGRGCIFARIGKASSRRSSTTP